MKPAALSSVFILALSVFMSLPAHADAINNILNKLRDKKVLSEGEYQELRADVQAESSKPKSDSLSEQYLDARYKDTFRMETKDRQNRLAFIGRVHVDYRDFTPDVAANPSTFDVRRAFLGVKGKISDDTEFEVLGDFAGTPELKKAWINFDWFNHAQIRVGQFTMPFGLETIMSSNKNDFLEAAMASRLAPDDEPGAMVYGAPFSGFTYALAVSNGAGSDKDAPREDKDQIGRVTFNFAEMLGRNNLVSHVGLAYSTGIEANDNLTPKIYTEGRGAVAIFQGAKPGQAFTRSRKGLELALAYGPFKLQGENIKVSFTGSNFERSIESSYVSLMWIITGESWAEAYKNGEFGNILPARPFKKGNGNPGAWEIGYRYSNMHTDNFTTGTYTAGGTPGAKASTLGLNWIPNHMTRIMLNYVYTEFDTPISGSVDEKAVTMRAQVNW